jgi:hypothetical protein
MRTGVISGERRACRITRRRRCAAGLFRTRSLSGWPTADEARRCPHHTWSISSTTSEMIARIAA